MSLSMLEIANIADALADIDQMLEECDDDPSDELLAVVYDFVVTYSHDIMMLLDDVGCE